MAANRLAALILIVTGLVSAASAPAPAQDFRIETTTSLVHPQQRPLVRTLTLFHAGRTYDYLQEVGELIIFEPALSRFTLVSTKQERAAVVHVDQINRMLQDGRQALGAILQQVQASAKPEAKEVAAKIRFQFKPQFTPLFTQENGEPHLDLTSPNFSYHVHCATPPTPQLGEAYLNYADRICRLNFVLQPTAILPDQRIALDDVLRKAQLIPIDVTFVDNGINGIQVRSEHRIWWELNDHDRELIRQWDDLLTRRELKRVSFRDYQQALLVSQSGKRR